MAQTKTIVEKTNRIRNLVFFTARMFLTFVLLLNATYYIWSSEKVMYTYYYTSIDPTPMGQSLYDDTNKSSGYIFNNVVRPQFLGLSIVFITVLMVIPSAVGIPIINTIFAAGNFKCALLLSPIWTIMVIAIVKRNISPFNRALLLCATVALAFAALVFLYKKGKKRIEEEKKTLLLIDNVVEQVRDGKSVDEIELWKGSVGINMSWESTNMRTFGEVTIKKLKAVFVSLMKIFSILALILLLLHFLNILPIPMFLMIVFPNEAAYRLASQISENIRSELKYIFTSARLNTSIFLIAFLYSAAFVLPFAALVYLFKKRKKQMEERKKKLIPIDNDVEGKNINKIEFKEK